MSLTESRGRPVGHLRTLSLTGEVWTLAPERLHRSIRNHVIIGLAIVVLIFGGVGGWAATTGLAGAVVAPGFVVVATSAKKIQHETGGIVAELKVREGDHVKVGDVLIKLDDTQTRATFNMMARALADLGARQIRLQAEQDDADALAFPKSILSHAASDPEVARSVAEEQRLFQVRHAARAGQKAQLKERITQLNEEIAGQTAQAESNARQSALIEEELTAVRGLWEKRLADLARLKSLEREAARLLGERGQHLAAVASAKGKIAETQLQIIQVDQDVRTEVGKELADVRAKQTEFTGRKITAEHELKHIDILSPQDGMVAQLSVHVAGEVISPREPIMLIVPGNDNLVAESKVEPQDRDRLHEGQKAVLRLSSVNQRATPEIDGEVTLISADLIKDERSGAYYYKVQVKPDAAQLARLGDLKLIPGMPVEAHVQTGERSALSYLLKPLRDRMARAFKEE